MISELDQQLLDEYLDGQLAPVDAQRLSRRLVLETELADELSALRISRTIRQNVFAALEPEPAKAAAFSRQVVSAARRGALRARFGGFARIGGGIAACIAIGFVAGWLGRGHGGSQMVKAPGGSGGKGQPIAVVSPDNGRVPIQDVAQMSGPWEVKMTNPDGRVWAQKFDRIEDAAAAADALAHQVQSNNDASNSDAQTVVYAGQE